MKKRMIAMGLVIAISLSIIPTHSTYAKELSVISEDEIEEMTDEQLSSISMLNYMTVLSQEINASQNNKLYLESVFSAIVTNINPEVVDEETLYQIRQVLDTIENYQMIVEKKERVQYLYEQNQANAILRAVPNPLGLLSEMQADTKAEVIAAIVFMAVDAISSYQNASSEADKQYMSDSLELDQEAKKNLNASRKETFSYMVEICNAYDLKGKWALTEKTVNEFVDYELNPNTARRIEFLESNADTYKMYGRYWLVLAKSYYEQTEYDKCISAIEAYKNLNIDIFKKDHEMAKALVVGISAAKATMTDAMYVEKANEYCELLLENIEINDWDLRYFVAQTYVDIARITNDTRYLYKAYDLAKDNVNYLIDEQIKQNNIYLNDVEIVKVEEKYSKEKKKEIKIYNKWLKEERKKELPPVYQPLVLNCELLFGLIDELNLDNKEKDILSDMLHPNKEALFLVKPLDELYWINDEEWEKENDVIFQEERLEIPVCYLASGSKIRVTVFTNNEKKVYEDWEMKEVDRKKAETISDYKAVYESKEMKKCEFGPDSQIEVEIITPEGFSYNTQNFSFIVTNYKKRWMSDKYDFEARN